MFIFWRELITAVFGLHIPTPPFIYKLARLQRLQNTYCRRRLPVAPAVSLLSPQSQNHAVPFFQRRYILQPWISRGVEQRACADVTNVCLPCSHSIGPGTYDEFGRRILPNCDELRVEREGLL